jgi:putative addiction module antidote
MTMARMITLRRVGGSVGTTLPKEMVDRLDLAPGDRVLAIETEQGILLTPYSGDLDAELRATRRAAKRYRAALRELAGRVGPSLVGSGGWRSMRPTSVRSVTMAGDTDCATRTPSRRLWRARGSVGPATRRPPSPTLLPRTRSR